MLCKKGVCCFYPNITLNDHEIFITLPYSFMRINVASLKNILLDLSLMFLVPHTKNIVSNFIGIYLFSDKIWRSNSHIHEKSHLYEPSCFSLNPISVLREPHPDVETEEGLSLGQSFLRPNSGIRSPRGVCARVDSRACGAAPTLLQCPHYRTAHFSTCRSLSFLQRSLQLKLYLTDEYSMEILGPTA